MNTTWREQFMMQFDAIEAAYKAQQASFAAECHKRAMLRAELEELGTHLLMNSLAPIDVMRVAERLIELARTGEVVR
jgi:UDP-N-acetylmuramate-alanine ligase